MNKNEFLAQLSRLLTGIPQNEKNEILYDYEEHFRIGAEKGKTEEEIATSLGDVNMIAKQFEPELTSEESAPVDRNKPISILAAVGMGFFNIVFILGPFFGLVGALIGLFAGAVAMVISGIASLVAVFFAPIFPSLISMDVNGFFAAFISIGITCLGLLFLIGDCYLAKLFYKVTRRYINWNIEIIKK